MFKFTGTTRHFSQAAQSLKNNLIESQDLSKWNCLKLSFSSGTTLKRSRKRGKKGFIRNSIPAMPFTPVRLPFFKKRKVPWVKNQYWLIKHQVCRHN